MCSHRKVLTEQIPEDIRTSIENLRDNILNKLVSDNINLRKRCTKLEEKLLDLEDNFYDLEVDVAQGQQHDRKENLEISGIPNYVKGSELEGVAIKLLNCLVTDKNNPVIPSEINACHRLSGKTNKPTIIRFVCRKRVQEI